MATKPTVPEPKKSKSRDDDDDEKKKNKQQDNPMDLLKPKKEDKNDNAQRAAGDLNKLVESLDNTMAEIRANKYVEAYQKPIEDAVDKALDTTGRALEDAINKAGNAVGSVINKGVNSVRGLFEKDMPTMEVGKGAATTMSAPADTSPADPAADVQSQVRADAVATPEAPEPPKATEVPEPQNPGVSLGGS